MAATPLLLPSTELIETAKTAGYVAATVSMTSASYAALLKFLETKQKRWLIGSILGYGLSTVPYVTVVTRGGAVAPIITGMTSTALATAIGVAQGQPFNAVQAVGAGIALGGVVLVQGAASRTPSSTSI